MIKPEFHELTTEQEWSGAWPVLNSLKPELQHDELLARREQLKKDGYRLYGLVDDDKIVTVAGISITPHLTGNRHLRIIDFATLPKEQSKGYGSTLLRRLEKLARSEGCSRIFLHSHIKRTDAHRFYESKGGYKKYANLFIKEL
ncbi:MAG: GNAT family N-acetyltransferase [Gammaproteobacteria bacterium]|nr:GNAT family N-acetyltransferase [Gammaproteobacteria bacterium]